MSEKAVKEWVYRQAIWQIYLPAPKYIPRHATGGDELDANDTHQADLLFLPYDTINGKTYKYALTVVDVGSRYKEAEHLRTKYSSEVAKAFETIYTRSSLTYPKKLNIDSGGEFKGEVKKLFANHNVELIVGEPGNHRAQGIVERFNRTLAEKLFPAQYAKEMIQEHLQVEGRSSEWVENLPSIIKVLNESETRLIKQKPIDAITNSKPIHQSPSLPAHRPQGFDEKIIEGGVRYLYRPGEQEGGERRRATDPIWSMKIYEIKHKIINNNQPILYYLQGGPKRSFVREELLKVPWDTELPPAEKEKKI